MQERKRCPYCDELIRSNAIKCKHCGSILTDVPGSVDITPETKIKLALEDKYIIHEEVGRGGMASVYRATQKSLNRTVALKVIHQNLVHDSEFLERFHREAQLAAALSHPNILTVYDEGQSRGVHFMCMEYLDGVDLLKRIRKHGKISPNEISNIIAPIADALEYVHKKGLIHRDVKTSNIILTKDGRSILTDFGIAHAALGTKLTKTGTVIGTPEYMSPEQAIGKSIDSRSDLYSLGVVMYECLTGKVPFKGDTPFSTIYQILNEPLVLPDKKDKKIPGWLSLITAKALTKDVIHRFQSGKEIVSALRNKEIVKVSKDDKQLKSRNKTKKLKVAPHGYNIKKERNRPGFLFNKQKLVNIGLISAIFVLSAVLIFLLNDRGLFGANNSLLEGCDSEILSDSEIERIETLIKNGDNLYNQGNLIFPESANALDKYKAVLQVCSYNVYVQRKISLISENLVTRINEEMDNQNYSSAERLLTASLNEFPNSNELQELKTKLIMVEKISSAMTTNFANPDSAFMIYKQLKDEYPDNEELKEIGVKIKSRYISIADSIFNRNRFYNAKLQYQKLIENFGPNNYCQSKIEECNRKLSQNSRVTIPNLVGMSLENARSSLVGKGLKVGNVSRIVRQGSSNKVINVIPPPGSRVEKGSSVGLIIGQ